tara:strand:+ start:434 stop:556 length:123 start_codon:yes stop_codon:yes gene_type:complete
MFTILLVWIEAVSGRDFDWLYIATIVFDLLLFKLIFKLVG